MRMIILSLALLTAGGPALADEAIRTAGAGSAPPSTDATTTAAQIERWLAHPPEELEDGREAPDGKRKIHGEVGMGVGTGGYRSGYVITHIPVGETGQATIAFGKTDYGSRVVPSYGYPGYPGYWGAPFD